MEDFVAKAVEKIEGGVSSVKDRYGKVVARPVADALISFCRSRRSPAEKFSSTVSAYAGVMARLEPPNSKMAF